MSEWFAGKKTPGWPTVEDEDAKKRREQKQRELEAKKAKGEQTPLQNVFVLPSRPEDIHPDISELEQERDDAETHGKLAVYRKFIPRADWHQPCPDCHKSWHSKPDTCTNEKHRANYQRHLANKRKETSQ
jgi:hypothetical protein